MAESTSKLFLWSVVGFDHRRELPASMDIERLSGLFGDLIHPLTQRCPRGAWGLLEHIAVCGEGAKFLFQ